MSAVLYLMDNIEKKEAFIKINIYSYKILNIVYITRQIYDYNGKHKKIAITIDKYHENISDIISKEIYSNYIGQKYVYNFNENILKKCFMKKRSIYVI